MVLLGGRGCRCWLAAVTPVISEIDIWRAAKQLIEWKGCDAGSHASERAAEILAAGDREGHAVWMRIGDAVRDLLKEEPDGSPH